MPTVNKHGLSRHIPEPIERQIRRACGFGCVVCGGALYMYEHIDPEFHEATEHDPEKMALVCASCHDAVTRGRRSKASIAAARKSPKCLQQGYSREALECGANGEVLINVGRIATLGCRRILRIQGTDVLWVDPPEEPGAPARLNARFYDETGQLVCEIVQNEIRSRTSNWDVEIVGTVLTIRRGPGDIALRLETAARQSIRVTRLRMRYLDTEVIVDDNGVEFGTAHRFRTQVGGLFFLVDTCIEVKEDRLLVAGQMVLAADPLLVDIDTETTPPRLRVTPVSRRLLTTAAVESFLSRTVEG